MADEVLAWTLTQIKLAIQYQLPELSAVFWGLTVIISSVTATRDLSLSAAGSVTFKSVQEIDTFSSKNKSTGVDIGVTLSASGLSPNASLNLGISGDKGSLAERGQSWALLGKLLPVS
jgi:Hemagglutinin repeat